MFNQDESIQNALDDFENQEFCYNYQHAGCYDVTRSTLAHRHRDRWARVLIGLRSINELLCMN